MEAYLDALKVFAEAIASGTGEIERFYELEDWGNYKAIVPVLPKAKLPLGLFPQGLASRRTRREILTRRLLVSYRPHL